MRLPKAPSTKRRFILAVVVIAMLVASATVVNAVLNAPVHGTGSLPSPIVAKPKLAPQPTADQISSAYFNLTLAPGFVVQPPSPPSEALLYSQVFVKSSLGGSQIISISITSNGTNLEDNSNYRLRSSMPDRYSPADLAARNEHQYYFSDRENAAVTAFWQHNIYLATINVTTANSGVTESGNTSEIAALKAVVNNWQWN